MLDAIAVVRGIGSWPSILLLSQLLDSCDKLSSVESTKLLIKSSPSSLSMDLTAWWIASRSASVYSMRSQGSSSILNFLLMTHLLSISLSIPVQLTPLLMLSFEFGLAGFLLFFLSFFFAFEIEILFGPFQFYSDCFADCLEVSFSTMSVSLVLCSFLIGFTSFCTPVSYFASIRCSVPKRSI